MLGPAMRTIGHTCSQRTDARSFPLVRAERTEQRHPSRKDIIKNVILLPVALPALWGAVQQPAQADGVPAAPEVVVPPPPKVKAFIARDFFFQYNPAAFKLIQDPKDFDPSPGGPRGDNPVRAEVLALDGTAKVTVVQSQAAKLKQSLLQVTDISKLGTPKEVIELLLPPTTKVLASSVRVYPQPPRDTGTVLGVIERDPVQIYRYEVILPSGQHAEVAVGALLGRVLLLGASTEGSEWERQKDVLKTIADSFKLLPK